MEVLDEVFVQYVPSRHQRPFLGSKSIPIHKILKTSPLSTGMDQTVDSEGRPAINKMGRRRGMSSSVEMALMDRLDLGHVEGRVNLHGAGKSQPAVGLMFFPMGNGSMNLGASFLDPTRRERSLDESHTFWPTW